MTLASFGVFRYKDRSISDYSSFIELILDEEGYTYGDDYKAYDKYYLTYNPLLEDNNSMSCKIHVADGIMLMYNGAIEVERTKTIDGKRTTRMVSSNSITPSEYSRILGKFDLYIDFILSWYNIPSSVFNQYKKALPDYLLNKGMGLDWKIQKGLSNFRKFLFAHFISDKDIVLVRNRKNLKELKKKFKEPRKKTVKAEIQFIETSPFNTKRVNKYLAKRMISEQSNVYPILVKMDVYSNPGVCFEYPSGFKKVRYLEGNLRYLASTKDGKYENLFECRVNNTKTCYILEGEFEGLSMLDFIEDDIYALHNVNSLPSDLTQLQKYDIINVQIDYDKFDEVKGIFDKLSELYPEKTISVEPKIICTDKYVDYNSLLVEGKLTKDIIQNITKF